MSSPTNRPPVIVTDTTCDLPPELFAQYNIHLVRHRVKLGTEYYLSGQELDLPTLYTHLHAGERADTAHPRIEQFLDVYAPLGANGTPILSIHLSLNLSSTITNARRAASMLTDHTITVWDSQTISAALGLLVLTAARAAQAGYTISEILPLLEAARTSVQFLFCVDDLSYLVRGGRVGKVSYYVAQSLGLKPIITVSKEPDTLGTYVSTGERPRSLRGAVMAMARDIERDIPHNSTLRAITLFGDDPTPKFTTELTNILRVNYDCALLETCSTTPVLAAHVGPRALGVGYLPGAWPV